jgi:hypothetical protein
VPSRCVRMVWIVSLFTSVTEKAGRPQTGLPANRDQNTGGPTIRPWQQAVLVRIAPIQFNSTTGHLFVQWPSSRPIRGSGKNGMSKQMRCRTSVRLLVDWVGRSRRVQRTTAQRSRTGRTCRERGLERSGSLAGNPGCVRGLAAIVLRSSTPRAKTPRRNGTARRSGVHGRRRAELGHGDRSRGLTHEARQRRQVQPHIGLKHGGFASRQTID